MEEVIDKIVEQLNLLADLSFDEGGFRDEISLVEDIWWGDPGILSNEQYPFMFVEPVTSEPNRELGTTRSAGRTLTIRIGLLADPREFYDTEERTEATASREMVRTLENIERHFERKTLGMPGVLGEGVKGVEVGTTLYATQVRGSLYSIGAQLTLNVDRQRPRLE